MSFRVGLIFKVGHAVFLHFRENLTLNAKWSYMDGLFVPFHTNYQNEKESNQVS